MDDDLECQEPGQTPVDKPSAVDPAYKEHDSRFARRSSDALSLTRKFGCIEVEGSLVVSISADDTPRQIGSQPRLVAPCSRGRQPVSFYRLSRSLTAISMGRRGCHGIPSTTLLPPASVFYYEHCALKVITRSFRPRRLVIAAPSVNGPGFDSLRPSLERFSGLLARQMDEGMLYSITPRLRPRSLEIFHLLCESCNNQRRKTRLRWAGWIALTSHGLDHRSYAAHPSDGSPIHYYSFGCS
jgi:hypothetical protein